MLQYQTRTQGVVRTPTAHMLTLYSLLTDVVLTAYSLHTDVVLTAY